MQVISMADLKEPGEKTYDGKIKGDSFSVINRCQSFCAEIFMASAGASKEYRFTICKVIQTYSCEAVHLTRQANAVSLENPERRNLQKEAVEYINKVDDMLPVIRRCRCISLDREADLHKKLNNLKISYNKWIESDNRRLRENEQG